MAEKTITVTARKPFVYQTRALSVGDRFECEPIQAAVLRYQGKITLASDRQPVVPPPAVEVPVPRTSRRARRALVEKSVDVPDPVPTA